MSGKTTSPHKRPHSTSFYDTSFRQSALPPEIALEGDWSAAAGDLSSAAEVSTATEESIVTETRRRLQHLTDEAENLHSAFKSLTRNSPPQPTSKLRSSSLSQCELKISSLIDLPIGRLSSLKFIFR